MTMLKPAIAALAAFVFVPAAAADQRPLEIPFAFAVEVSAKDVANTKNAMKFLNRLERRVRKECGGDLRRSLAGTMSQRRADVEACVDATMRDAVNSLRSPTIAQAFDMRRG